MTTLTFNSWCLSSSMKHGGANIVLTMYSRTILPREIIFQQVDVCLPPKAFAAILTQEHILLLDIPI